MASHKSVYLPDYALIVRNTYIESFLFVLYCETYTKYILRKFYLPKNLSLHAILYLSFIVLITYVTVDGTK